MRHPDLELREQVDVLRRHVNAVGGDRAVAQYAQVDQLGNRGVALLLQQSLAVLLHRGVRGEALGTQRIENRG